MLTPVSGFTARNCVLGLIAFAAVSPSSTVTTSWYKSDLGRNAYRLGCLLDPNKDHREIGAPPMLVDKLKCFHALFRVSCATIKNRTSET